MSVVEVVEHDDQGLGVGDPLEERRGRVEEPEAAASGSSGGGSGRSGNSSRSSGSICGVDRGRAEARNRSWSVSRRYVRPRAWQFASSSGPTAPWRRAASPRSRARPPAGSCRFFDPGTGARVPRARPRGPPGAPPARAHDPRTVQQAPAAAAARATRRRLLDKVERRVLPQDRAFELLERTTGIDTELVDERPASLLVGPQRLCLASAPVEPEDQLAAQALLARAHELLKLGDEVGVPSEREVGLDTVLERGKPSSSSRATRLREELVREIREGRAAPQSEASRSKAAAGRVGGLGLADEALELRQIEAVLVDA